MSNEVAHLQEPTDRFITETDPIPTISFSRELADAVHYIDIDYDSLTGYMIDRGYTDEEIAETEIVFDNKVIVTGETKNEVHYIAGDYNETVPGNIAVHPRHDLHHYQSVIEESQASSSMTKHLVHTQHQSELSEELSETVAHELEHKIIDLMGGMKAECHKNRDRHLVREFSKWLFVFGAVVIGKDAGIEATDISLTSTETYVLDGLVTVSLAPFVARSMKKVRRKVYASDPEEKLCFEAGANAPKDFVMIQLKTSTAKSPLSP